MTKGGKGPRCSRPVVPPKIYCTQHQKMYEQAEALPERTGRAASPRRGTISPTREFLRLREPETPPPALPRRALSPKERLYIPPEYRRAASA